jgi:hypothetical protein
MSVTESRVASMKSPISLDSAEAESRPTWNIREQRKFGPVDILPQDAGRRTSKISSSTIGSHPNAIPFSCNISILYLMNCNIYI